MTWGIPGIQYLRATRAQLLRVYSAVTLRPFTGFTVLERDLPMAETILVVGSASIDQQSVIWHLLKADYWVRYAASNSSAVRIISTETPSVILLADESGEAQAICSLIRRATPATSLLVIGQGTTFALRRLLCSRVW